MLPVANTNLSGQRSDFGQNLTQPLLGLYDTFADRIASIKIIDLAAFLTAYALFVISHMPIDLALAVLIVALTCVSKFRNHCLFWFAIVSVWLPRMIYNFHLYEDHCFFMMYWCLAFGLALLGKRRKFALRRSARLLIGTCFAIGFVWKVVSSEFIDGSLFHFKLLFDYRFSEMVTGPVGGLSAASTASNLEAYLTLRSVDQPANFVPLDFPNRVSSLAWLMTVWTVAIEGLIAIMFLLPSSRIAERWRDLVLIFFMLSTYIVVPVLGFASAFVALGVAQARSSRVKLGYLLSSIFLLVWFSIRWKLLALFP